MASAHRGIATHLVILGTFVMPCVAALAATGTSYAARFGSERALSHASSMANKEIMPSAPASAMRWTPARPAAPRPRMPTAIAAALLRNALGGTAGRPPPALTQAATVPRPWVPAIVAVAVLRNACPGPAVARARPAQQHLSCHPTAGMRPLARILTPLTTTSARCAACYGLRGVRIGEE